MRCGVHVPQHDTSARVCDVAGCVRIACQRCHPDLEAVLECETHRGWVVQLVGAQGPRTYTAAVAPPPVPDAPAGAAACLNVLFACAAVLLVTVVASSAASMERSWRFFTAFLRFVNVRPADVTPWVVMSYVIARCQPPVGMPLPEFMSRRVLPKTAAADLTALRRRARLMKDPMIDALTDEDVLRLGTVLGANVKRSKTEKAPILIHHLQELWDRVRSSLTLGLIRNVLLLVVGLVAGLRRRELAALTIADCVWSQQRSELTIRIRRDKTNQVITDAQHPRVVCVAHDLLTAVWVAWAGTALGKRGTPTDLPLFPRLAGNVVTQDFLAPGTVNTIVRELLPGLPVSPHSLRVGFATELHAAGVPLQTILEIGRWSSLAGLLYVLPSADRTTAATRKMGDGSVVFDRVLLQQQLRAAPAPPRVRRIPE